MRKLAVVLMMLCMVLAMAAFASDKAKAGKTSMTGYISDEKCGAKVNADCAKKCIEGGQKAVFVNDADKSVVAIANPDKVKGHEGHHVTVTGSVTNDELHIDSLKMAKESGM